MTATNETRRGNESPTEEDGDRRETTDATADVEHRLGGVACASMGFEAFATPEEPARFVVDACPPQDGPDGYIKVGFSSDTVGGATAMTADQARALADRLETAAAELEAQQQQAGAAEFGGGRA